MRAIRNKYRRWYKDLMARAKLRGKIKDGEKHHAIPKSLGGSNARQTPEYRNKMSITLKAARLKPGSYGSCAVS